MDNGWGWHGWGMGFGFIFLVLFWALVAAGLVALVRWVLRLPDRGEGRSPREDTSLTIARERYARGEISREQFEQLKKDLQA